MKLKFIINYTAYDSTGRGWVRQRNYIKRWRTSDELPKGAQLVELRELVTNLFHAKWKFEEDTPTKYEINEVVIIAEQRLYTDSL